MHQGDIYLVDFLLSVGHEYKGRRPAVIIQSNGQLKKTSMVTVMPISSQISKNHSDDIAVAKDAKNRLMLDSLIKVHHIKSLDSSRFIKKIGAVDETVLQKVGKYLKIHFDL